MGGRRQTSEKDLSGEMRREGKGLAWMGAKDGDISAGTSAARRRLPSNADPGHRPSHVSPSAPWSLRWEAGWETSFSIFRLSLVQPGIGLKCCTPAKN